jgi:hypothetical protein
MESGGIAPYILYLASTWGSVTMPRLGAFTPGDEPQYPFNRAVVGSQFVSGLVDNERNICPLVGNEVRSSNL